MAEARNSWLFRSLFLSILMGTVLGLQTSQAEEPLPPIAVCESCASQASFAIAAEQYSLAWFPFFEGYHDVYVMNPWTRQTRAYSVYRWYQPGDFEPQATEQTKAGAEGSVVRASQGYHHAVASEISGDGALLNAMAQANDATLQLRDALVTDGLVIPPGQEEYFDSAIDLLGPTNSVASRSQRRLYRLVNDMLNEQISNFEIALGDLAARLIQKLTANSSLLRNLAIRVTFPDGSSVMIRITEIAEGILGSDNLFEIEIELATVRLPGHDVDLPQSIDEWSGFQFSGPGNLIAEIVALAWRYGIPVNGTGSGRVVCRDNADGNYECTLY
ncbi:MAG: hypothetical protein Kow0020_09320 [Wenzhouxiangellaceae bacterium]